MITDILIYIKVKKKITKIRLELFWKKRKENFIKVQMMSRNEKIHLK